ncbi:MAG: hypothetical protein ACWA5W_09530 [Phycisphaerales bacterium]
MPIPAIGMLAFIAYLLIAPITQLVLYINVVSTGIHKAKPYPRPCPRWLIPLIAALACLPGTAIYIAIIFLADTLLSIPY